MMRGLALALARAYEYIAHGLVGFRWRECSKERESSEETPSTHSMVGA